MFRKLIYLVAGVVMMLSLSAFSGCSSDGSPTPDQSIATACAARATALEGLTTANDKGKLTAAQQSQVLRAIAETESVCNPADGKIPTLDQVKRSAFDSAVRILESLVLHMPAADVYEPTGPNGDALAQENQR